MADLRAARSVEKSGRVDNLFLACSQRMSAVGLTTYLITLVLLCVGTFFRAPVALAAVLCMYGLDQLGQVSHPWLLNHQAFTNVAVGCILILGMLRKRTSIVQLFSVGSRAIWLVYGLYSYAFISLVWTPVPHLAWQQWLANGLYILTVAMTGPLLVTRLEDLKLAMQWTAAIGAVISIVILFFGQWGMRGLVVGYGTGETNPLAIATLAGVVASASVFVGFGRRGFLEWILRLGIAVVCLVLIIRSGSRGQLVAAVIALVLMIPVYFNIANFRGLVAVMSFGGAIVLGLDLGSSLYIDADARRWTEAGITGDVTGRLAMSAPLLSAWSDSAFAIIFGLGNSAAFDPSLVGGYPHNMPIEVLGEEGIVGFVILLLILGEAVRSFFFAWKKMRADTDSKAILSALGAAFVFSFLLSLKQGSLLGNNAVFLMALLIVRVSSAAAGLRDADIANTPHADLTAVRPILTNLMR